MPTLFTRDSQPNQPTRVSSAPALRQAALSDLGNVESYPTLSDTALRVMEMANQDDSSVAEAASIIRRDSVLAARVLRAANSCLYRGKTAVEDVQQAVLRLGTRECMRLLCAVSLRKVYEGYPQPVRARCDAILRHSLFVGRLAAGLARLGAIVPPTLAFTAGLLHDIGRVVLCVKCDGVVAAPPRASEDDDTPAAERAVYGIDHCAIGYQFATHNSLPETVVRTVLNHHRPDEERFERTLVALIAVAEGVASHVQRTHSIADYDLSECSRFEVLSADWGGKRAEAFRTGLAVTTVQALRDTRRMLKSVT